MKSNIHEKNIPVWINKSQDFLDDFISLYEKRPIKYNKGGMLFTHMFYFYLILKNLKPELIIESGVFKGQSTWSRSIFSVSKTSLELTPIFLKQDTICSSSEYSFE